MIIIFFFEFDTSNYYFFIHQPLLYFFELIINPSSISIVMRKSNLYQVYYHPTHECFLLFGNILCPNWILPELFVTALTQSKAKAAFSNKKNSYTPTSVHLKKNRPNYIQFFSCFSWKWGKNIHSVKTSLTKTNNSNNALTINLKPIDCSQAQQWIMAQLIQKPKRINSRQSHRP